MPPLLFTIFMRFKLTLYVTGRNKILPLNYQYELSSAIYRIISAADKEFCDFLHNKGYAEGHKQFRLFTFSPLNIFPYKIYQKEERIEILSDKTEMFVSFFVDKAAETFIKGLFQNQVFEIGDKISTVRFEVAFIEAVPMPLFGEAVEYECLSPIVVSWKSETDRYAQYLSPTHPNYEKAFVNNLISKYRAMQISLHDGLVPEENISNFKFELLSEPRKKGITIKKYTPEETKVIGYVFRFRLTAPAELQELGYCAGFGEKNGIGFGMGMLLALNKNLK